MSDPFLAEIRIFGFNFAPRGWAMCDGQILPINQNQSLYSLLGTTYGGDGRTTFALPELRGRTPIHSDASFTLGQRSGEETHALTVGEMPAHQHVLTATSAGGEFEPEDTLYGSAEFRSYANGPANVTLGTESGAQGSGQGHNNMQPYLALNFCIALQGLFPSRN